MPDPVDNAATLPMLWDTLASMVQRSKASESTKHANRLFAASLAGRCAPTSDPEIDKKPFDLQMEAPLPPLLRIYMFTMTTHLSERQVGAYRIQIILPKKSRHFDTTDDPFVILAGFDPNLEVFALWDAAAHDIGKGIPHSKGVQIREGTLLTALSAGLARQRRSLRDAGETETVVASRPDSLPDALELRWQLSIDRLTS